MKSHQERVAACREAIARIASRKLALLSSEEEKAVNRVMLCLDNRYTITESMVAEVNKIAEKYNP